MSKGYTINFNGESAKFFVSENENLIDRLNETLYIVWELEPVNSTWRRELQLHNKTRFSFHNIELFDVQLLGDIIEVINDMH